MLLLILLSLVAVTLKTGEETEDEVRVILVRQADAKLEVRGGEELPMVAEASRVSTDPGLPAADAIMLHGVGGVVRGMAMGVVAAGVVEGVCRGVEGAGVDGAGVVGMGVLGVVERLLLLSGLSMLRLERMPDTVGRAGPLGFTATALGSSFGTLGMAGCLFSFVLFPLPYLCSFSLNMAVSRNTTALMTPLICSSGHDPSRIR